MVFDQSSPDSLASSRSDQSGFLSIETMDQATSLIDSHPQIRPYLPGVETCPRQWCPPEFVSVSESSGRLVESHQGVGGYVSSSPDDFHVHEVPRYFPSGEGEHTLALILKVGRTTEEATFALAKGSNVSVHHIGYAGRKDKQALTTQWMSIPVPVDQVKSADEQVIILNQAPHHHKIKLGHHAGNFFAIRISELTTPENLEQGLARLRRGIPNYFERQRFGRVYYEVRPEEGYHPPIDELGRPLQDPNNHATDNVDNALRLLNSRTRRSSAKRKRYNKLALSALQSALFNLWVGERIRDDLMDRVILGDVCRKVEGGTFYSTEPEVDTARLMRGEIEVLGPLVGPKLFPARDIALAREEALYHRWGITAELRSGLGKTWRGDRRALLLKPVALAAMIERAQGMASDVRLTFCLPSGSFATALLGALIDPFGGPFSRRDSD